MKRYRTIAIALLGLMLCGGCDNSPQKAEYIRQITVFGYLQAGVPMTLERAIRIGETQPIDAFYDPDQAVIRQADVRLEELESGNAWELTESAEHPGRYFNAAFTAKPGRRYRLEIKSGDDEVTAETTVPLDLTLTTTLRIDTVNVETPSGVSKRHPVFLEGQGLDDVILVDVYCNEAWYEAEYIHPFFEDEKFPEEEDEYDSGGNGEPRHIQGMARLKELVSDDFPDQYVVDWFSSMLVFYGSYTITVGAIDANYHNFLHKNYPERKGGIEGGIGVFGSWVGQSYELEIVKEP